MSGLIHDRLVGHHAVIIRKERTACRNFDPVPDPDRRHIRVQLAATLDVRVITSRYRATPPLPVRICVASCNRTRLPNVTDPESHS